MFAVVALLAAVAKAQAPGQFVLNTCDYAPAQSFDYPQPLGPSTRISLASADGSCVGLADSAGGVAAVLQPCAAAPLFEFVDRHLLVNTSAYQGLCLGGGFVFPTITYGTAVWAAPCDSGLANQTWTAGPKGSLKMAINYQQAACLDQS